MFWRIRAQCLLVERGSAEVLKELYAIVRHTGTDDIGLNPPAAHALWTMHGPGVLDGSNAEALAVAEWALTHPVAGVRKTALCVLPRTARTLAAVVEAGMLKEPSLNARLAVILTMSELPPSESAGALLYAQSLREEVIRDAWLPEALFIAASKHRSGFLDAYSADIGAEAFTRLVAGAEADEGRVDWSAPDLDATTWQTMTLPMPWVSTDDLASFDGVVWFRKEVDAPAAVADAELRLGGIYDSDITYVNGVVVGVSEDTFDTPRIYGVPPGVLQEGRNVIAVRVEAPRGRGGFWGEPEQLYLRGAVLDVALASEWRYAVEEEYVGGKRTELGARTPIARQFLRHHLAALRGGEASQDAFGDAVPVRDVVLSVLPGELQFDRTSFTAPAGQVVRLVFTNPGEMPHNVVITAPGAAEEVGALVDVMQGQSFVPETPSVLFSTEMVDPKGATSMVFRVPAKPGDYPYLCTFPGHWRVMQGAMIVTAP